MKTILIIDDDEYINAMLEAALIKEGYGVMRAFSVSEALLLLEKQKPDLILLDLMLPGLSGEEIIKRIKDIPVIVISAKIDTESKVSMLLEGACDYVLKPFELKELLARISVHLRLAAQRQLTQTVRVDDIVLDIDSYSVTVGEKEVKLTKTEFSVLKILMLNSPNVVARSVLLDKLSYDTPDCTESSLKVHISNLRKKLREVSGSDHIENVWGIGFRIT